MAIDWSVPPELKVTHKERAEYLEKDLQKARELIQEHRMYARMIQVIFDYNNM